MSTGGLLVSLPQMVDLAIGSPEVGAVNFNLLCTALQVMIQQLSLQEHTIDLRGPDVERFQALIATAKPGISVRISEPDEYHRGSVEVEPTKPRRSSKRSSLKEKIVIVEPSQERKLSGLPQVVVGVSQELFVQIHNDVEDLKTKMSEILEIPQDETIIDAVKGSGQTKVTPVIDMWQALNIAKRVQAAEEGMNKLAGMFESLIHELGAIGSGPDGVNLFADIGARIEALENKIENCDFGSMVPRGSNPPAKQSIAQEREEEGIADEGLVNDVETLKSKVRAIENDCCALLKGCKGKNFLQLFTDFEEIRDKIGGVAEGEEGQEVPEGEPSALASELQEKLSDLQNKFNSLDETFSAAIEKLQEQLMNIEKDVGSLTEASNVKNEVITDAASMGDLFNKIVKQQEEIENINHRLDGLNEDVEEKTLVMEALTEQVEHMKTIKADREDLEDALADKADNIIVNRKVSTMQFESACEDLTRHIEDTVKKLTEQEEMWQNTLTELQLTIGGKLDKEEFNPLKDFVNKKIKSLQQRLKALLAMKQEAEAAGTKNKILKNVNCISCDNDVIMYRDNKFSTLPAPAQLPGSRSIKPYITYELDAVRKQQKLIPGSRNMNALETALHDEKPKRDTSRPTDKALPASHLCNRYCGGSHTMTQPQQRVAHIGHFLNQWGPQAIPLDEGQITGTDGNIYKSREGGESPKATAAEKAARLSAQIQTDSDSKERIPRMSSTLEPLAGRRSSAKGSRTRSTKKMEGDQLEPVKEEGSQATPRRSSQKDRRSSAKDRKSSTVKDRKSSVTQPRPSQDKKGSKASLKRVSSKTPVGEGEAEGGDETVPPAPPAEGEGAPAEPVEGGEEAAPAPEMPGEVEDVAPPPAEAPPEAEEGAPAPPPDE